ncbi:MAG TPA: anti-sigma factor [Candidatus Limnocylindria bacterium]|nr:anti-sigma factor [Candidatus Limnocylindria bacterium]
MNHAEAVELAGLYALDALEVHERALVDAHIASCPESHEEFAEVGAVAPALATLAEPVGAPASLKNKVMADYRAATGASQPVAAWDMPRSASVPASRPVQRPRFGWVAALAAVLVIAVVGGYAFTAQQRADREQARAEQIAGAIDVMTQPDATVALISGTGSATGAHGFAAFPASGAGYIVMVGLPDAPAGQTYQAWYLVDGQATSAGVLKVDSDGYAILDEMSGMTGANLVALTIERAGGVDQPTSDPVAAGELRSNSAAS